MPVVQTYGPQKVAPNALPGVRQTAAATPESEGAGVALATQRGLQEQAAIGERFASIGMGLYGQQQQEARALRDREAEKARQIAIQTQVLDGENQLSAVERGFYAQGGAFTVQGKDALAAHDDALATFDKAASAAASGMSTPEARLAFQKVIANRRESVDTAMLKHADNEIKQYNVAVMKAHNANGVNAAIVAGTTTDAQGNLQFEGAQKSLAETIAVFQTQARAMGVDEETIKHDSDHMTWAVNEGIINQLVADDNPQAAQEVLDHTWGNLDPTKRDDLKEKVKTGSVTKQSQDAAARILAEGGTEDEMLDKARKEPSQWQDQTVARIEHEVARKKAAKNEARRQQDIDAYNWAEQHGSINGMPGWNDLEGGTRSSLLSYLKQRADKADVQTNLGVFYEQMQLINQDPVKWAHDVKIMSLAKDLGKTEMKQLIDYQHDILAGAAKKADSPIEGIQSNLAIVNDVLLGAGLDPTPKPGASAKEVTDLRAEVDRIVAETARLQGKTKLDGEEVRQIANAQLAKVILQKGSWGNIIPGGQPFYDVTKRIGSVTLDDISVADKAEMSRTLTKNKLPVNDATILAAYRAWLLKNAARAK